MRREASACEGTFLGSEEHNFLTYLMKLITLGVSNSKTIAVNETETAF